MANEIRVQASVRVENGSYKDDFRPGQILIDQSNPGRGGHVQSIGSGAEEDIDTGDVSTLGWMVLRNIDTTNYVIYGPKSGGVMIDFGRIEAGEIAVLRLEPGITITAQADTATVKLDVRIYED